MKLTALGILFVSSALVSANPYQYRYTYPTYYPPTIYLPAYGAGYQVQPGAGEQEQILLKILQELKAMRAENQALKAGLAPDAPPHLAIFAKNCVQCHDAGVANKKGAGFVLMDNGKPVDLTAEQRLEVIARTHGTGDAEYDMPLGGPKLDDEAYSKIVVGLGGKRKVGPRPQVLPVPKQLEKVQDK